MICMSCRRPVFRAVNGTGTSLVVGHDGRTRCGVGRKKRPHWVPIQ